MPIGSILDAGYITPEEERKQQQIAKEQAAKAMADIDKGVSILKKRPDLDTAANRQALLMKRQATLEALRPTGKVDTAEFFTKQYDVAQSIPFVPTKDTRELVFKIVPAVVKIKKGERLSLDEDLALQDWYNEQETNAERGRTIAADAWNIITSMPAYMGEFAAGKAVIGNAAKAGGVKLVESILKSYAQKGLGKFAAKSAGVLASGAAMAATTGAGMSYTSAAQNYVNTEDSALKSAYKGFVDAWAENTGEQTGGAMASVFGKITKKVLPQGSKMYKAIATVDNAAIGKKAGKFLEKVGYNGTLEEMGEERFSAMMRAVLGTGEFSEVLPSGKQLATEAIAFAVPGAVGGGLQSIDAARNSVKERTFRLSYEGASDYADKNPQEAAYLAGIQSPSRTDFEKVGLKGYNQQQRQQFADQMRKFEAEKLVSVEAESPVNEPTPSTPAVEPQNEPVVEEVSQPVSEQPIVPEQAVEVDTALQEMRQQIIDAGRPVEEADATVELARARATVISRQTGKPVNDIVTQWNIDIKGTPKAEVTQKVDEIIEPAEKTADTEEIVAKGIRAAKDLGGQVPQKLVNKADKALQERGLAPIDKKVNKANKAYFKELFSGERKPLSGDTYTLPDNSKLEVSKVGEQLPDGSYPVEVNFIGKKKGRVFNIYADGSKWKPVTPKADVPSVPMSGKPAQDVTKSPEPVIKESLTTEKPTVKENLTVEKGTDNEYLYHTTQSQNIPSIIRDGLGKDKTYLSPTEGMAEKWKNLKGDTVLRIKNNIATEDVYEGMKKTSQIIKPSQIEIKTEKGWEKLSDMAVTLPKMTVEGSKRIPVKTNDGLFYIERIPRENWAGGEDVYLVDNGGTPVERFNKEGQRVGFNPKTKTVKGLVEEATKYIQSTQSQKPTSEQPSTTEKPVEVPAEVKAVTEAEVDAVPVSYVNISDIKLSKDVPQFKENADPTSGVVKGERLTGKYKAFPVNPIVLWERLNGDLEVITGRHRLDLARQNKMPRIAATIKRERDGFTVIDALTLDAEANIMDEKGSVKDYAKYFRNTNYTREQAEKEGLLSRTKGRTGFEIGRGATDGTYSAFLRGEISESKAAAIAEAAPMDEDVQSVAVLKAKDMNADELREFVTILKRTKPSDIARKKAKQGNLFGFDDSAIQEAELIAKEISKEIRATKERILSVKGALKRPKQAQEMGLGLDNQDNIKSEVDRLENWLDDLSRVYTTPSLMKMFRERAGLAVTTETVTPQEEIPVEVEQELAEAAETTRPKPEMETLIVAAAKWKGATLKADEAYGNDNKARLKHSDLTSKGDLDDYLMKKFGINDLEARQVSNSIYEPDMTAKISDFVGEKWADNAIKYVLSEKKPVIPAEKSKDKDLFGTRVIKPLKGNQGDLGFDTTPVAKQEVPVKKELVQAVREQYNKGEREAKSILIELSGKNELFNNTSEKLLETQSALIEVEKGKRLFQSSQSDKRGQIEFTDNGAVITLLQNADASTLPHELAHFFLRDMAKSTTAEVQADMAIIRKWLNNKGGNFTREQEERFARAFEAYLRKGKAPTTALQRVFDNFKAWLSQVYKKATDLKVVLSPEIAGVFDRMLGGNSENPNILYQSGTSKGDIPKRSSKYGVGKAIGGRTYVHKQYENVFNGIETAKAKLPKNFTYDIVSYEEATGSFTFSKTDDWNNNPEPAITEQVIVKDGNAKSITQSADPWIYHHKYLFVKDNYTGFDVEESKNRSRAWINLPVDKSRIGKKSYWESNVVPLIGNNILFQSAITDEDIAIANSTSRGGGSVGANALVPRMVRQFINKDTNILDFGAGKVAQHAESLKQDGYKVTAYEFGMNINPKLHDKDALSRQYDVVYASNVINVQNSEAMLESTIDQIYNATKDGGVVILNLPSSPRKGAYAQFTTDRQAADYLQGKLSEKFNSIKRIGGTASAPVFIMAKGAVKNNVLFQSNQSAVEEPDAEQTSAKNKFTEEQMRKLTTQMFGDNIPNEQTKHYGDVIQNAVDKEYDKNALDIADTVLSKGIILNDEQVVGLSIRALELSNQRHKALLDIAATTDAIEKEMLMTQYNRIEADMAKIYNALNVTGTDTARALSVRRIMIDNANEWTLPTLLAAAEAKKGKPLTEKEVDNTTNWFNKYVEKSKELDAVVIELRKEKATNIGEVISKVWTRNMDKKKAEQYVSESENELAELLKNGCYNG